ncbi:hypothetical protein ACFW0V_19720 [Micromonospora parva]|uniref:hypothetical protein n=1 Tax=Micromonospora parva TaxID=1464048 RepID=UPI00366E15CE
MDEDTPDHPPSAQKSIEDHVTKYVHVLDEFEYLTGFTEQNESTLHGLEAFFTSYERLRGTTVLATEKKAIRRETITALKQAAAILEDGGMDELRSHSLGSAPGDFFHRLCNDGVRSHLAGEATVHMFTIPFKRPRYARLYSSLLIAIVGACEVFLGSLMKEFLGARPQILKNTEVRLLFSDLASFDDLDSFKSHQIDRQVEAVIRQGGIDEWMKWFEDKLRIQKASVTRDFEAIREMFQRRHIHVHNDGRVSDLYLQKLPDLGKTAPRKGSYLAVDAEYLLSSINHLRVMGIVLSTLVSQKLSRGDATPQLDDSVATMVYDLLSAGRHELVDDLVKLLLPHFQSEAPRLRTQINGWIARSRLGDSEVEKEATAWDTSALSPVFKLAQLVLTGQLDDAQKEAITQIERGSLDQEEYDEWPLFLPLRQRFQKADQLGVTESVTERIEELVDKTEPEAMDMHKPNTPPDL